MSVDAKTTLGALLDFLERLEKHRISYRLEHNRPESIMVVVAVPGERWEVEFMQDGEVEVERFASDGKIGGEELLASLFALK
ncbi:MAG: hypothetical protein HY000_34440 [Planctomycetes bacterium]|nr:hypothetical protein [Planctomycetota bacterium]